MHRKAEHIENVSNCRNFSDGNCTFSDEDCWSIHGENLLACEKLDFNCTSCGKLFKGRFDFMKHRNIEHRNAIHGACSFSDQTCWFVQANAVM